MQTIENQIKKSKIAEIINVNENVDSFEVIIKMEGIVSIKTYKTFLDYFIQINIPKNLPESLPTCLEYKNAKLKGYHHLNPDNTLCIGTDVEIRNRLLPEYNISKYIEMIGEYLTIFEYYSEYGTMPVVERNHGQNGIVEGYKEILNTSSLDVVITLLESIPVKNKMRNQKCLCGSEKLFKNCHFNQLKRYSNQSYMKKQIQDDLESLKKNYGGLN